MLHDGALTDVPNKLRKVFNKESCLMQTILQRYSSQVYDKYSAIIIDFVIPIFLTILGDTEGLSRGWGD